MNTEIEQELGVPPSSALTLEDIEILRSLESSVQWKRYRQILIRAKEAYFHSTLPMSKTSEIVKTIGIVTGINYAINQVSFVVAEHDRRQRIDAERKAKSEALQKGRK